MISRLQVICGGTHCGSDPVREVKRQLVELLTEQVLVEMLEREGQREARVKVRYRFTIGPPVDRHPLMNRTPLAGGDDGSKQPVDSLASSTVVNDHG